MRCVNGWLSQWRIRTDMKPYHKAARINQSGGVSALCFKKPRAIDLSRALWTIRDEVVTCKKCLAILGKKPLN